MRCSTDNREEGFTLIELLIAMVIALVVLTSISSAFIMQRKTYDVQEQITEMIQNARAAMDMISREVNMAGYSPTGGVIVGIPIYTTSQLKIVADLNADGVTDYSNENITYTFAGTNITRNTGGGDQPFAENIDSCTFAYYDIDGATATGSDIRQVEITVTAKTAKPDPNYSPNSGYRTYTLTSYVTPPNLDI